MTQGLFTRKIPRPQSVNCSAFAQSGEILTGDSDGNVMIWGGVKVIRVLKGAHEGSVADICVMDDGSFVSGGLSDGSFVVFNKEYQLIGAGAVLPGNLGNVRTIQKRSFSVSEEDGSSYYHLLAGTTANSIVDVSFTVVPDKSEIESVELEVLVQGHAGEIRDVRAVPNEDKFVSGGGDKRVILWDAVAHKAIWTGAASAEVNCLAVATDRSGLACGLESGALCYAELENLSELTDVWSGGDGEESITSIGFYTGSRLAAGTSGGRILMFEFTEEGYTELKFELSGHSEPVIHLDWSSDGKFLRTNGADYSTLYWNMMPAHFMPDGESRSVEDGEEIDDIGTWDSQR